MESEIITSSYPEPPMSTKSMYALAENILDVKFWMFLKPQLMSVKAVKLTEWRT